MVGDAGETGLSQVVTRLTACLTPIRFGRRQRQCLLLSTAGKDDRKDKGEPSPKVLRLVIKRRRGCETRMATLSHPREDVTQVCGQRQWKGRVTFLGQQM